MEIPTESFIAAVVVKEVLFLFVWFGWLHGCIILPPVFTFYADCPATILASSRALNQANAESSLWRCHMSSFVWIWSLSFVTPTPGTFLGPFVQYKIKITCQWQVLSSLLKSKFSSLQTSVLLRCIIHVLFPVSSDSMWKREGVFFSIHFIGVF